MCPRQEAIFSRYELSNKDSFKMIVQINMAAISVWRKITKILILHRGQYMIYYDLP